MTRFGWDKNKGAERVIEREIPRVQPEFLLFECVYSSMHRATILHRGTAYCRACYDEHNRTCTLID